MNRRQFIVSAGSIPLLHPRLALFAQEPVTTSAMIDGAIKAAIAAQEIIEKRNFNQWQSDVTEKLDKIERNTERILADLQQLRIDFKVALKEEFKTAFENQLEARRGAVSTIIVGLKPRRPIPQSTKSLLLSHLAELQPQVTVVAKYGFATLPFVLSGYATLMSVMKLVERNPAEIEAAAINMYRDFFGPAVDVSVKGSFAWAEQQSKARQKELLDEINYNLRQGAVGSNTVNEPCGIWPEAHRPNCINRLIITTISGNPENPASFSASPLTYGPQSEDGMRAAWVYQPHNKGFQPRPFTNLNALFESPIGAGPAENTTRDVLDYLRGRSRELLQEKARTEQLEKVVAQIKTISAPGSTALI